MTNKDLGRAGDRNDLALRERFEVLREFDRAQGPSFESVLSDRAEENFAVDESPFDRWFRPGVALAFAGAAATALWFGVARESALATEDWAAGQWAMPTDVLLDLSTIPGSDLLYELPTFAVPATEPLEGAYHSPAKKRIQV